MSGEVAGVWDLVELVVMTGIALVIAALIVGVIYITTRGKSYKDAVEADLVAEFLTDDEKLDRVTLSIAERLVRGEDLTRVFVQADWLVALPSRVGESK